MSGSGVRFGGNAQDNTEIYAKVCSDGEEFARSERQPEGGGRSGSILGNDHALGAPELIRAHGQRHRAFSMTHWPVCFCIF